MITKVTGVVEHGAGRGTGLGYPTANVRLSETLPTGIYAGYVYYNAQRYPAAIFYGAAETFNDPVVQLEVHILDFSMNIYGKVITVEIHKKIRESKKYTSTEELIQAIEQDIKDTRICLQA